MNIEHSTFNSDKSRADIQRPTSNEATNMKAKPQRIQLSRRRGFDLQAASRELNGLPAVNCARPGPYGNPFIVGVHGTRARCVKLFRALGGGFLSMGTDEKCYQAQKKFINNLPTLRRELRGKNLACWCGLKEECHVKVIFEILTSGARRYQINRGAHEVARPT